MAIVPRTKYAAQTVDDAGYPQGKARNVTVAHDGTGTPLEKDWVNDIWGFLQSLLAAAGIDPSGDPDQVGASDYLDAIKYLIANVAENAVFNGTVLFNEAITAAAAATFNAAATFGLTALFEGAATFQADNEHYGNDTWHDRNAIFKNSGGSIIGAMGTGLGLIWTIAAGFSSVVVLTGAGRIVHTPIYAPDTDHTYSDGDGSLIIWGSGITGSHTIKFNDTTWSGTRIRLVNYSVHAQTLQNSSGGSLLAAPSLPAIDGSFRPGRMNLSWVNNGAYTGWSET